MENKPFTPTSRERMLDAITFNGPDKIPVVYHPSPAGLYIHGEKLRGLFKAYPPDNPVDFEILPSPPMDSFDANGRYHEIKTDTWGTDGNSEYSVSKDIQRLIPLTAGMLLQITSSLACLNSIMRKWRNKKEISPLLRRNIHF